MTKKNELEMIKEEVRTIKITLNSVTNWISAAFGVDLTDKGKIFDSDSLNRIEFRTSSAKIILPKPPPPPPVAISNLNAFSLATIPLTTVHGFNKDESPKKLQQQPTLNYGVVKIDSTSVVLDNTRPFEGYSIPHASQTNSSIAQGSQESSESARLVTFDSTSNNLDVPSSAFTGTQHEPIKSSDTKEPKKRKRKAKPKPPKDAKGDESGSSEGPIQCEMCGKFLSSSLAMKRHLQTHRNSRPYSCQECGKSFQRNFHLKTHLMIHSGEKKHQCRFCGRLFLLPKDLICHERTHTGEKPFECTYCFRKFNLKSHLTMHTRTHTGEKPYKCDLCDKTFSQSNSLRVHKKTHLKAQDGEGDSCTSSSQTPIPSTSSSTQSQRQNNEEKTHVTEERSFPVQSTSGVQTASLYENIHVNLAGHLQPTGAQLVAILEPGHTVNMPITFRQSGPSQAINVPIAVRPNPSSSVASAVHVDNNALENRVVWLCPDESKRIVSQNSTTS